MRILFSIIFAMMFAAPVQSQGLSVIRDTEIENILQQWAEPVLETAGLSNDQVRIVLINSPEINAFVAGGANIFIYSGLVLQAEYPEEVIGVLAHEVGHITGGHLIATRDAMEKASYQSILATVLGIGAAGAISAGGSGVAASGFLTHSRVQESAADQAGLKYLEGAQVNPTGIVSFLEKLQDQELLPASQQSEYRRTHPLTRDRIESMKIGANKSQFKSPLGQSTRQDDFDIMKAKLRGFIEPQNVTRYFDSNSTDIDAQYAHAIMHYRQKHYDQAVSVLNQLTNDNPGNPYFYELKAQTLRDAGQLSQAEINYKRALGLIENDAPLIQVSLAHVMIEQQKTTAEVENLLKTSLQMDRSDGRAYRLLATLSGRQGKEANAQYYLAEEAASQRRHPDAKRLINLALNDNNLSSDLKMKAKDLKTYLNRLPNKGK